MHPEEKREAGLGAGQSPAGTEDTWTCISRENQEYKGSTWRSPITGADIDTWSTAQGERKHVRAINGNDVLNYKYETDPVTGANRPVEGRTKLGSTERAEFKGTIAGQAADFVYMNQEGSKSLSAKTKNSTLRISPDSPEFLDAMKQLEAKNFDPPCQKPQKQADGPIKTQKVWNPSHPFSTLSDKD